MTTLTATERAAAAQALRDAAVKARSCMACGKVHVPRPHESPGHAPQWGDPADGHPYRRTQSVEVAEWLDGLARKVGRGGDRG